MTKRVVSGALVLGFSLLASPVTAQPGPADGPSNPATPAGERVTLEALEVQRVADDLNIYDLMFGFNGYWTVSDANRDRLVDINFSGGIVGSVPLNLLATNLVGAADKNYFAGVGSDGTLRVGYEKKLMIKGAFLPPASLSQGGGLAVLPNDTGVVMSKSQSLLLWFSKDYATPVASQTLPGPLQAIDVGPGGNFYVGNSVGILTVTPSWAVSPLQGYTANVLTVKGCGDYLWVGGPGSFARLTLTPQFSVLPFTTNFAISSIDCGQNGTAIAVGAQRTLFFANPGASSLRAFQLSGTGEFVKISLAPGLVPAGLILDAQHRLTSFILPPDIRFSFDRNSSLDRPFASSIRYLF